MQNGVLEENFQHCVILAYFCPVLFSIIFLFSLYHDAQVSSVSLPLSQKITVEMLVYLWNNQSMCISLMKRIYLNGIKKVICKQKQSRKNRKLELMKVLQYQTMKVRVDLFGKTSEKLSST